MFRELLAHPRRVVVLAAGATSGLLGIAMAVARSSSAGLELLGVLAVAAALLAIRVRPMAVLWLTAAGVVVIGVVGAIPGLLAAGPLAPLAVVAGLAGILW